MRNLLGTLALLAIIFAVVGWSRNWFTVSKQSSGSETEVHLKFNRDKIREDTREAAQVARKISENIDQKIAERSQAADAGNAEPPTLPASTADESNPWLRSQNR